MDALIHRLLNATHIDEWLNEHGLSWIISQRIIETVSVVTGSIIVYYLGRILISWAIKHMFSASAKYRS